jgi:hypothetical protein
VKLSMGRPAERADWRDRIEPIREQVTGIVPFVYRFESGLARRLAAPIDTICRALARRVSAVISLKRVSVTLCLGGPFLSVILVSARRSLRARRLGRDGSQSRWTSTLPVADLASQKFT